MHSFYSLPESVVSSKTVADLKRRLYWYWHQRADERHGNPPQGNQELLMVRDKVGRPPGELGVSKSVECDLFPSVLRHCWLGDGKGIGL